MGQFEIQPTMSMIAAIQKKDRGLGFHNELLYRIPEDHKRFKAITSGHPVIMGKKTFDSIGRPLPERLNIVLTRNANETREGCIMTGSLEEALRIAAKHDQEEIFVLGGGEIYSQALPYADKLYLTIIDGKKEADTFFPEYGEFSVLEVVGEGMHEGIYYEFQELTKSAASLHS